MARRSKMIEQVKVEPQETGEIEPTGIEVAHEAPDQMDSMSVAELNDLIERATAARDGKIGAERQAFIDRIRAEAEGLGLSMQDLVAPPQPEKKTAGGREPAPVKYRRGDDTWTGRGRLPNWLTALEATGQRREEFLVR